MQEMTEEERKVDWDRALKQWLGLYQFLASQGIVYLLPSQTDLQDQTYVANIGVILPHTKEEIAVVSNFYSAIRRGETAVGDTFFKSMGFQTIIAPEYFEGEADLKHLRDNIYFGSHGIRTSKEALDWFSETYDMKVIPIKAVDEYRYHLDCTLFVLGPDKVLFCTEGHDKETIRSIEQVAEIIPADIELVKNVAFLNNVKCGSYVLCDTTIEEVDKTDSLYGFEKKKLEELEKICSNNNLELKAFEWGEFDKSGAALSCSVMRLNYPI
jgi:N-dimethylarginine dimethylaminohydrolase